MADKTGSGQGEPAMNWYPVDHLMSDDTDLPTVPRALYIGVTGNLTLRDVAGNDVTFTNLAVGYHALRPKRILSTGSTATGVVALY